MALNKDVLGLARYNATLGFNNKTEQELIDVYGTIEASRLAYFKADSEAIIEHFKANISLNIPGTGLVAGATPVTGTSITGTIL